MIKKFIILFLTIFILAACGQQNSDGYVKEPLETKHSDEEKNMEEERKEAEKEEVNFSNFIPATVVRVIDGDTLIVNLENGREERVRMLLIDTPETVHPDKPEQPFGREASNFSKEIMPEGSRVHLELDVGERDKYGRILAYVWVGDQMVNEMLLERGLARVAYVYAPNTKHVDRFYEIQKEAQRKGIGIWSIENYATEEGFQDVGNESTKTSAGQTSKCENPLIKGNINSRGERIYHVPGGQFYEQTIAEEMFCTEEEAVAAGYRKSKR